jgi:hypothetical protein
VTPPPSSSSQRTPLPFRQATPPALSIARLSHCHVATPAASPHRHAAAPNLLYGRWRSPPSPDNPKPGFQKLICFRKPLATGFAKTTNIDKIDRFLVQNLKTNLNKIQQTKMINRSVSLIY